MASQPFNIDVFVKGPLTVGTDLTPAQIQATLHLQQPEGETNALARFEDTNGVGLDLNLAGGTPNLQGASATGTAGLLALNQAGGNLQLGSATAHVSVPGDLTVTGTINGRTISDDGTKLDDHLANANNPHGVTAQQVGALPLTGGTLAGELTVQDELTVTGRTLASDRAKLDSHVADVNNPHGVTTQQLGALPLAGGTLTGALTVQGELIVTGRSLASDRTKLDGHLAHKNNPHDVTAQQVGALPLTGGTLTGDLTVRDVIVGGRKLTNDRTKLDDHVGNKSNPHGVTAQQVGALPLTGGTLTGTLNVKNLQMQYSSGGYAAFGHLSYSNEAEFKRNNIKLSLGSTGGFVVVGTPPLEYEFAVGHVVSRLAGGNGPILRWVHSFVKKFSINQDGTLYVAGGKTGYVVDYFVNKVGDALEQGDVVVLSSYQPEHYSGTDNNVPLIEADLTTTAYDARVCGIVAKATTEAELPYVEAKTAQLPTDVLQALVENPPPHSIQSSAHGLEEANLHPLQHLAAKVNTKTDRKTVEPDHMGVMVTLGAFAHCKVDADIAPIAVGDLLTTSPTRGHAQKVTEPAKAIGAIIGKALGSLARGKGQIPVLVMLQ